MRILKSSKTETIRKEQLALPETTVLFSKYDIIITGEIRKTTKHYTNYKVKLKPPRIVTNSEAEEIYTWYINKPILPRYFLESPYNEWLLKTYTAKLINQLADKTNELNKQSN